MRLNLHKLIKPELEQLKELCNFTDEETEIFDMLARNKSRTEIAFKMSLSIQGVDKVIRKIRNKIERSKKYGMRIL